MNALPEVRVDEALAEILADTCRQNRVERLESQARACNFDDLELLKHPSWLSFVGQIQEAWRQHDHIVVRGLPITEDGASLLAASLATGRRFRTYRGDRIVKKFSMSPWTRDLSHTTREGDFHTDINTAPEPPALTAIQCLTPDPGAPEYGQNRVARGADLLACFERAGRSDMLRFLRQTPVTMVNGQGQSWTGAIAGDVRLRYHPATLRDATQTPEVAAELENRLNDIHAAALDVSVPFDLHPGDALFVSNHRALHYRGECSVRFTRYPTEYDARSIFVLHQLDEPQ